LVSRDLSPSDVHVTELAGEQIQQILTSAPGNGNPIGGIKVIAKDGRFAVRPSGTEENYKIYAEVRTCGLASLFPPATPNFLLFFGRRFYPTTFLA